MLVQLLTAPIALIADAASYLFSAVMLVTVRIREPRAQQDSASSVFAELGDGLSVIKHDPMLWAMAGCIGTAGIFLEVRLVLLILFAARELGLDALAIGAIMAAGSVGGMLGAVLAPRLIGRMGLHQTFVLTVLLVPVALAITPLATGTAVVAGSVLLVGQALFQMVLMASNVCFRTLRQQLSPTDMLGRVNATMRLLTWGGLPVGALLGGLLGEHLGLRTAMGVAAAGAMLGCAWLIPLLAQSASRTRTRRGLFARA